MSKEKTKAPAEQTEEVKEAAETKETPKEEELEAENPLKEELEKLKKEKAELNDHYIRMLAEYENFRKRSQREKDGIYGDAVSDTVAKLLPILDSFDRASNYECPDEQYKKGIDLIGNSIKEAFDSLGIKEIPALGEKFDPKFHNAVMHIDNPAYEENVITDVYRKGYTLGDKVIRFSMVVVAN